MGVANIILITFFVKTIFSSQCPDYPDQIKISNTTCCSSLVVDVYNLKMTIFPEPLVDYSLCPYNLKNVESVIFWYNCVVEPDCGALKNLLPKLRWITFLPNCVAYCYKFENCADLYHISGQSACTSVSTTTTKFVPTTSIQNLSQSSGTVLGVVLGVVTVFCAFVLACALILRQHRGSENVRINNAVELRNITYNDTHL